MTSGAGVHAADDASAKRAIAQVLAAITIGDAPAWTPAPLVMAELG